MASSINPGMARSGPVRGWLALGCALALATGCVAPKKAFWQKHLGKTQASANVSGILYKDRDRPSLVLDESGILGAMAGTVSNDNIVVSYSEGLQAHAALWAQLCNAALAQTKAQLNLPVPQRLHLYLLHLPGERRAVEFQLPVRGDGRTLPCLAVLTNISLVGAAEASADNQALLADLADLPLFLFIWVHELYEMRLVEPPDFLVMPDISGGLACLHWTWNYHTRWFREGYANYAGYSFNRALLDQVEQLGISREVMPLRPLSLQPFAMLARVNTDLFHWNQRGKGALEEDYYAAALGLFLLLEHRAGAESIARVVDQLPGLKHPNGAALLRLFREQAGVDPKAMVREFTFPDFGLNTEADLSGKPEVKSVRPGGPGAEAGLQAGDLLLEVNGHRTPGLIELEWELLRAAGRGQGIHLTVLRQGQPHLVTLEE